MTQVSRRDLLKTAGAAGAVSAGAAQAQQQQPAAPHAEQAQTGEGRGVLFFFNDPEGDFIEAAVDRLIPAEPEWQGARWAGVLHFIDRQLAGAFGAGARMYLKGPWEPDAPPQQGYQLRHTPAEVYRIGIEEARVKIRERYGREFVDLATAEMDAALTALETGEMALPTIPSAVFFETLLANTVEGFFADPAYGGNRDMIGWRMVGFPGAYAQYVELVDVHDLAYSRAPISIADQQARLAHIGAHRQ